VPQKAQDVKAALLKKGFQESSKRDHEFYFFHYGGKKTNIFTKISHGEREIHDKNCSSMAKQMKLTGPQFRDFVSCPLKEKEYLEILIKLGHVGQQPTPSSSGPESPKGSG
jgi:predicted RNA binding protein YcfA (HicA-like mRNA interferase family)